MTNKFGIDWFTFSVGFIIGFFFVLLLVDVTGSDIVPVKTLDNICVQVSSFESWRYEFKDIDSNGNLVCGLKEETREPQKNGVKWE
jgi:hypothetical protein